MERNLCLLILTCANLLGADFIFSAHISTTNHVLTYQDFFVSPSMQTEQKNAKKSYICTINEKKSQNQSQYNYLLKYKEKLLECFFGQQAKVYDTSITTMLKARTNTQLFITPIRFRAIFGEKSCKIFTLTNL